MCVYVGTRTSRVWYSPPSVPTPEVTLVDEGQDVSGYILNLLHNDCPVRNRTCVTEDSDGPVGKKDDRDWVPTPTIRSTVCISTQYFQLR